MPTWTEDDLIRFIGRVRPTVGRVVDLSPGSQVPRAEPKRAVRDGTLAATQGKACRPARFLVRVTSRRRRLADPDNLAGGAKSLIDCLRYAGAIPDDNPAAIDYEPRQEKVRTQEEEVTILEVIQRHHA